jgi:isopenicillin-N epimerase
VNNPDGAWLLDPEVTFLNHGSLGSCPAPVLEAQSGWRQQLERQPIQFLLRDLPARLAEVRASLGQLVRCDPDELALMPNAEACINAVLRSLEFRQGDELLATTHDYNACLNSLDFVAQRWGARVVRAAIPFPISDSSQVTESVLAHVSPRTRLAMVSHITSATGLVFPMEEIVRELEGRGVQVVVDGAHAPGQIDLDLDRLGASYYAGNCHKWLCCPKGTGFLYVRRDREPLIHPLIISHGMNDPRSDLSLFRKEFDWQGVADPTGFLAIPTAITFLASLVPGGIPGLAARNHELALSFRDALCPILRVETPAPDSMMGSMAAFPIDHLVPNPEVRQSLEVILRESHHIEIPMIRWRPAPDTDRYTLRVSCQIYNDHSDLARLATALAASLEELGV